MTEPLVLGIDIGGVLTARSGEGQDTIFTDRFLETPEVEGAFESIASLVQMIFGERACVVSKCGQKMQEKSLLWLEHHDFYKRTGVSRDKVYFCKDRIGKVPICKDQRVTHFVDDRLEILRYLMEAGVGERHYLFRGGGRDVEENRRYLSRAVQVLSWQEIVTDLVSKE